MRSKLLALHLVLTVLNSHMPLFVDPMAIVYSNSQNEPMPFVQAINQHLCLCLSRNAVSPVPQVFEISVEIFWRVLSGMRTRLKVVSDLILDQSWTNTSSRKKLKYCCTRFSYPSSKCELPHSNRRLSSWVCSLVYVRTRRHSLRSISIMIVIVKRRTISMNSALKCSHALTLADSCSRSSFINIISKFASMPVSAFSQKGAEPSSPALSPTPKNPPPTVSTSLGNSILNVPGSLDASTMGLTEGQLRRQGIECLVSVLRSLVTWGIATGKGDDAQTRTPSRSQTGEEGKREPGTPDGPTDRLSVASSEAFRQPTPELEDDPTRFESAKQKKTTLLEGIKKFNFKPKKVGMRRSMTRLLCSLSCLGY